MKYFFLVIIHGVFLLSAALCHSLDENYFPVGGFLRDIQTQEPLQGEFDITFSLYTDENAPNPFWTETHNSKNRRVSIADGYFSVYLGVFKPIKSVDIAEAESLWLGIKIGQDEEMSRLRFGIVPFALESQVCHEVTDALCSEGFLKGWEDGRSVCKTVSFHELPDVPSHLLEEPQPYSAGEGLTLDEESLTFSVDPVAINDWCYDEVSIAEICNAFFVSDAELGQRLDSLKSDFAPIQHEHDASYQKSLKRTIVVSPVGIGNDNERANGDALLAAMNAIVDAKEESPYLIRVEPGTYLLEDEQQESKQLLVKPWVDIEGAGRNMTKICGKGTGNHDNEGVIIMESNSELRNLTVENYGLTAGAGTVFATAVTTKVSDNSENRISNVILKSNNSDDCRGIRARGATLFLENVDIETVCKKTSTGIYSDAAAGVFHSIRVVSKTNGTATKRANSIRIDGGRVEIRDAFLQSSQADVGESWGIMVQNVNGDEAHPAELSISDTTIEAIGELGTVVAVMTSFGADTGKQNVNLHNCILKADGPNTSVGLKIFTGDSDTTNPASIDVFNSQIISDGPVAAAADASTIRLVSSFLKGQPVSTEKGDIICAATIDENYTFRPSECP